MRQSGRSALRSLIDSLFGRDVEQSIVQRGPGEQTIAQRLDERG